MVKGRNPDADRVTEILGEMQARRMRLEEGTRE